MDDRLRRALTSDDPLLQHWAVTYGVRWTPDPAAWLPRVLAILRDSRELDVPAYSTLREVPWSTLKGFVAPVLFDPEAPETLRCLLWVFWAEHEEHVPPCPGDVDLMDLCDFAGQQRAERIWCARGHCDHPIDRWYALAAGDLDDVQLVLDALPTFDTDTLDAIWPELLASIAPPPPADSTVPARDVIAALPEAPRARARLLVEAAERCGLEAFRTDAVLLRVQVRLDDDERSAEELVDAIVQQGPTDRRIALLQQRFRDDAHVQSLAERAIDCEPRTLLRSFADRIPAALGSLLVEHWADRPTNRAFFDVLAAHPTVLEIVAGPFLDGAHASQLLHALVDAPRGLAASLLLPRLDGLLPGLLDDGPLWVALASLADPRTLPFLERHASPSDPKQLWAWHLVTQLEQLPPPPFPVRGNTPEPDDEQAALRVQCTGCGVFTTHAVRGVVVVDPQTLDDAPEGWDGVCPDEILTCPSCGAVDAYRVHSLHRSRLREAGLDRRLASPEGSGQALRDGIHLEPRSFLGEIATRPSRTEQLLREALATHPTAEVRHEWLRFHYLTHRDEALREAALAFTTDHPEEGSPWWHRAMAAELAGDGEDATTAALAALACPLPVGALDDCLGILRAHAAVHALHVRWRHARRILGGVLDLDEVDGALFLAEVEVVSVEPVDGGPAGWVERWMAGERPSSRAADRAARKRRKSARKHARKGRRR